MAARIEIDELNSGGTVTHGVSNLNVGSIDAPNIVVSAKTGFDVGTNAFTKHNQIHFIDLAGAAIIRNVRIWLTPGGLLSGETIQTNLTIAGSPYVPVDPSEVPTRVTYIQYNMPTSEPSTPPKVNIGIHGDLSGSLTAAGTTDVWKWQIQTSTGIADGALVTKEFNVAWDET